MERILVVDADAPSRAVLAALVEGPEIVVEEATNGHEALDRLRSGIEYDVIVSDIGMPEMDGIELSGRIRQLDPAIVTILTTDLRNRELVRDAMRAGASDFLWKPHTIRELNEALDRARERRKQAVAHKRRQFVASIQAHARAIDAKDAYTAGHCDRVERYTELLARRSGAFTSDQLFNLRVAAILHDVGKIGVPGALLCKPGVLEPEEQRLVESHPVIGGRIVRALEGFNLEPAVRHHHERFDGEGYPDGLKGDQIPIEARLILAADTFDAMTSNRPYRRALDTAQAMEELQKFSGRQFDPEVVDLMNAAASDLEAARIESMEKPHALEGLAEAS